MELFLNVGFIARCSYLTHLVCFVTVFLSCFISALACGLRQLEVYTRQHKVVPPWALALPREGHTRGAAHSVMSTWFWAFPCLQWNGLEQHLKSLLLLGFFCTYWSLLLLGCHLALLFHLSSLSSEESVTKWDSHYLLVPFTGQIRKCTFLSDFVLFLKIILRVYMKFYSGH